MWAARYFSTTYWTPQYWPHSGAEVVLVIAVGSWSRPDIEWTATIIEKIVGYASAEPPDGWPPGGQ